MRVVNPFSAMTSQVQKVAVRPESHAGDEDALAARPVDRVAIDLGLKRDVR